MAQSGRWRSGRARPLCPGISDINLFRYCQSIVYFDAKIPDRAFDFGMAKSGTTVDQRGLCSPERMRPKKPRG
jgi:hypothetical protein